MPVSGDGGTTCIEQHMPQSALRFVQAVLPLWHLLLWLEVACGLLGHAL